MHHVATSASLVLLTACLAAQPPAPEPNTAPNTQPAQAPIQVPGATQEAFTAPDGRGVTHPAAHLGRPVAVDFQLADWVEVSSYYKKLADESPRVTLEKVGETTEGRDFLVAIVTSEANHARLPELKRLAARIADPRGITPEEREAVLSSAVPFLFVSPGMHSTETAAAQFGMEFTWELATSDAEPWASAREEAVVFVLPCTNPDGLDHVVEWYRETVGTPHEASSMTKLYQYYTGHDNNRDWFMLTQAETRNVTRLLYREWHPQVYWDVHQQGQSTERFFVPPFRDPLNPNLDPGVISGIGVLGGRALLDMTREGLTGVSTGVTYDMWWNGGNRNVPVRHNIIGILTEAASVNLASPVFKPLDSLRQPTRQGDYGPSNRFPSPWPGGWWRLRDIVDYELAFGRSLLGSLTREPRTWLANAMEAAERAVANGEDAPRAWLLPATNPDPGALRRLVDVLLASGVEVSRATTDFVADGRSWPAGTLVVLRSQPYGAHVKDLLEVQRYPDGDPPYDVAGWTLPFLLGVRRVELVEEPEAELEPFRTEDLGSLAGTFDDTAGAPHPLRDSDTWAWAFARLAAGEPVAEAIEDELSFTATEDEPNAIRLPRIGLYSPWTGSMDEGWMRWVFDTWGVPYVSVRNEMLRAGELSEFLDVLVIPSVSGGQLDRGRRPGTAPSDFTGGLDPEGAVAVEEFVRGGGGLITLGSSSDWAIELFQLPLEDVTRGPDAGEFSCPGSVLRGVPVAGAESGDQGRLVEDLPDSLGLFFSRSAAWKVVDPDKPKGEQHAADERALDVLLRYAPTRLLLSGWIREPEVVEGRAAWVRAEHGAGRIHLFAFRPQYRGWSQGTFGLVFRALLLDGPAD